MTAPQPDIIALGEPMMEFNQTDPARPETYIAGPGGDTSNAAVAAARQGAKVGYLTALGTDLFGDQFIALWQNEDVDCRHVVRNPDAHTAIYFVSHSEAGHAFAYFRAGSAASRMTPHDLPEAYIAGAKFLHLSGISQAISDEARETVGHAMAVARAQGVRVAYDTNLRLQLWDLEPARTVIHGAVAQADIALPGLDDATALTGLTAPEAIVEFYCDLGPEIVALKCGAAGVWVAAGDRRAHVPGHKVNVVDATAAGDTFDGAFLAALLRDDDPIAAARYANTAAALSTTGYGAVNPIPHRDEVERFLADS